MEVSREKSGDNFVALTQNEYQSTSGEPWNVCKSVQTFALVDYQPMPVLLYAQPILFM
jgi:hypothetical protein